MTDTIGWGEVEVDAVAARRRRRLLLVAVPVVVVALAAAVLVPVVRRSLADGAAAWLQKTWVQQQAYGDARSAALEVAVARTGPGDLPTYHLLIHAVDQQEAAALSGLNRAIRGHRTWSGDVTRAAAAATAALAAETADLESEAARAARASLTGATLFVPSPLRQTTEELLAKADAIVTQTARAHSVRLARAGTVRLTASDPFLRRLAGVTDRPLPFHLVLVSADGAVSWDLTTGAHRSLTSAPLAATDPALPVVDSEVLVDTDDAVHLLPLDGSPPRVLPDRYTFVPDGRGGLWRIGQDGAQRVTATGAVQGPLRRLPDGFSATREFNSPPMTDLVVLDRQLPGIIGPSGVVNQLWDPDTGRTMNVPSTCAGIASAVGFAAYAYCNRTVVNVLDRHTERTRAVKIPGGYDRTSSIVMSPDGASVAVGLGASGGPAVAVAVVDLRTHEVHVIPDDYGLQPAQWSPDSSTLVLLGNNGSSDALAYWQPGMSGVAAIRIPVAADETHLAIVP